MGNVGYRSCSGTKTPSARWLCCRIIQEALNTKASQVTKRILTRLVITAIHLDQYPTPDIRSHRFAYANTLLRTRVQEHRTPKSFPQGAMVALGGQVVASAMALLLSQFVVQARQACLSVGLEELCR